MTNTRFVLGGAMSIGFALITSNLWAQVQQESTTTTVQSQVGSTTQIRTVSTVIGSTVKLQSGDTYGKIEDIVLNDSGCLEYVVVSYEDQYYVVPWTVAKVNYQERTIILNTTQQDIRQVAFSRNDWRGVSYDQVSQKARQVFSSATGDRGGRVNRPGGREDGQPGPEGREGPARKARPNDRPEGRDISPDGTRPRDPEPKKKRDRPRPKSEPRPGPGRANPGTARACRRASRTSLNERSRGARRPLPACGCWRGLSYVTTLTFASSREPPDAIFVSRLNPKLVLC